MNPRRDFILSTYRIRQTPTSGTYGSSLQMDEEGGTKARRTGIVRAFSMGVPMSPALSSLMDRRRESQMKLKVPWIQS